MHCPAGNTYAIEETKMTHLIDPTEPATLAASVAMTKFDRIVLGRQTSAWLASILAAVDRLERPQAVKTIASCDVAEPHFN
jgi:hypothetical protein